MADKGQRGTIISRIIKEPYLTSRHSPLCSSQDRKKSGSLITGGIVET